MAAVLSAAGGRWNAPRASAGMVAASAATVLFISDARRGRKTMCLTTARFGIPVRDIPIDASGENIV